MDINNIDIKKVAVAVFIVLILLTGIYSVQKKYFVPNPTASPSPTISAEEKRDNQRKEDLSNISKALDAYAAANNGMFPNSNNNMERISDENDGIYSSLRNGNFLAKNYKDPLSNNFYGYKSDGYYYELTAVLESKNSTECVMNGKFCIYTIGSYSKYDDYDYLE